jgi:hypothetical protein
VIDLARPRIAVDHIGGRPATERILVCRIAVGATAPHALVRHEVTEHDACSLLGDRITARDRTHADQRGTRLHAWPGRVRACPARDEHEQAVGDLVLREQANRRVTQQRDDAGEAAARLVVAQARGRGVGREDQLLHVLARLVLSLASVVVDGDREARIRIGVIARTPLSGRRHARATTARHHQ